MIISDVATGLMKQDDLNSLATAAERYLRQKPGELTGCTSYVQRHLQCGYNRAAALLEILEQRGTITEPDATGKRHFLT